MCLLKWNAKGNYELSILFIPLYGFFMFFLKIVGAFQCPNYFYCSVSLFLDLGPNK
jgi:hypothetical protein